MRRHDDHDEALGRRAGWGWGRMRPYWSSSDGRLVIYHGDARDVLPAIEADVLVTDPPYGTGGWRRTGSGQGRRPKSSRRIEAWDDGSLDWLVLADFSAVVTFWPNGRARTLLNAAHDAGLVNVRCLYMRKVDPMPTMADTPRWSVEPIWALWRDRFALRGGTDVCDVTTPRLGRDREALGHPYQKPLSALTWLVSKIPDLPMADPFMGSGTTLAAALQLGRACIGIEADEHWCEVAAKRLEDPPMLAAMKAEQRSMFEHVS